MKNKCIGIVAVIPIIFALLVLQVFALNDDVLKMECGRIDSGYSHTLAVKSNGTVWAWGENFHGELGNGTTTASKTPVQVKGLKDVISVSAGQYFSLAIKKDGTLWAWGHNFHGYLGDGTTIDRKTPVQVKGMNDVIGVSAGYDRVLAIKKDGTLWSWGAISMFDDQEFSHTEIPTMVSAYNYRGGATSISSNYWISEIVLKNGDIERGCETSIPHNSIKGLKIDSICSAGDYSIALDDNGCIWHWEYYEGDITKFGMIYMGNSEPEKFTEANNVTKVSASSDRMITMLKNDGTVHLARSFPDSQLEEIKALKNIVEITSGYGFAIAVGKDGTIWQFSTEYGEDRTPVKVPITLIPKPADYVIAIQANVKTMIDNEKYTFDVYIIEGKYYLKLRDLAMAFNESTKKFEVAWEGSKHAISISTGLPYTPIGGEFTRLNSINLTDYVLRSDSPLYKDGKEITLKTCNINGNNYVNLVDVSKAIDFGVTWNISLKTIQIDTISGYGE